MLSGARTSSVLRACPNEVNRQLGQLREVRTADMGALLIGSFRDSVKAV